MSQNASRPIVRTEISGRIARIVLDRPPVNALSLEMIRGVVGALRQAGADPNIRAVILASAVAQRFSAGLDLDILLGKTAHEIRPFVTELYLGLHDAQAALGKPSIAAVGGTARGGGMTMAISCDTILASDSATFGYPEIDAGVLPAIHFAHLPKVAGRHRAFELLFSGRAFDAREALSIGLVAKVVAEGELDTAAQALAETFATKSERVVRMGRAAFHRENDAGYRDAIERAVEDFCEVVATDAAQEGIRAFVEKRKPRW
jgi:enoyl-CoA hydratase/carnithine racemase